jgi:glyoxylase-like metal-dependent hydrolase (beta-lactamase superfamily II)
MATWRIKALNAGTSRLEKSIGTYLTDCGKVINIPNTVFLIEGPETIVVDTGFESVERTMQVHKQQVWRTEEQELPTIFTNLGLRLEEIRTVIFTHLHYDHCGNNRLFPHARFIVQKEELRYAFVPAPGEETAYFSPLIGEKPSFWGTEFEMIEGDATLTQGIRVIATPGHTPGCQAVLVDTSNGVYCIAGDNAFFYENVEKNLPVGALSSRLDWFSSMERMRRLSDHIIPSHEPLLFESSKYPTFP